MGSPGENAGVWIADTRLNVSRFAAFAFAIWSLSAAEDFLALDGSGDSAASELVGAKEAMLPSQEAGAESTEALREESESATVRPSTGTDGFLKRPPLDAFDRRGRLGGFFEVDLGGSIPYVFLLRLGL